MKKLFKKNLKKLVNLQSYSTKINESMQIIHPSLY